MWLEVLYWIDHVWSSIECVCCTCSPSERLDLLPYVLFVFLYVGIPDKLVWGVGSWPSNRATEGLNPK